MSKLLDEWIELDKEHKEFVMRVMSANGCKYGAEPHCIDSSEPDGFGGFKQTALWIKTEESGFIECLGSYKWITTDKFSQLHREVFDI